MATKAECDIKGEDFDEANEMCVAKGSTTVTYQGPLTLTVENIRDQINFINSILEGRNQDAAGDLTITEDEMEALQKQAYSEFVQFAEGNASIVFSQEDFATAVGATPDTVFDLYYKGIGDLDPLEIGTTEYITTQTGLYADSDAGKAAAAALPGLRSVFGTGTQAASWVPEKVTRRSTEQTYDAAGNPILTGVQSPTDYELMTSSQLAPYLPTAARDVTKISQNTPAYTTTTAGLSPTLFDQINFPKPAITRGSPVISRGFDALGRPNTAITMGRSTATPTGPNIGNLNTWAQFPSTGMGIGPTGLGTTTTGTMDTTGNIVSTGADEVTQFVDPNNALNTSTFNPNVINTGGPGSEGVIVTPTEVDLSKVPGSVAFCKIDPNSPFCTPGTPEFCGLSGNLNDPSCQAADTCLSGQELWNGICVDICEPGFTRDADGICQRPQVLCPAGSDKAGQQVPAGQTQEWCSFPKCPTGTVRETDTIPVGAPADWCDIPEAAPTCPAGTAKEGDTIPEGQTTDWCSEVAVTTCPAGTAKEGDDIPDGQTEDWCSEVIVTTCPPGTDKEGDDIPDGQTVAWCTTGPVCPALTSREGQPIPDGEGEAWCHDAPRCPDGTLRGGTILPDGAADNFCELSTGDATHRCTTGTVRAGDLIPAGEVRAWCEIAPICPAGTAKEGDTIPDGQTEDWCSEVAVDTCPTDSELAGDPIPEDGDCNPTATAIAACEAEGGTWDNAAGCVYPNTCPANTAKEGDEIPDGQTQDWCCGTGYSWDNTEQKCVLDEVIPTCPANTAKEGREIPDGQTQDWCCGTGYHWDDTEQKCELDAPTPTCPTGTDKEGKIIPDNESEDAWCNCPTGQVWNSSTDRCEDEDEDRICPVGTAKAGVTIPDDESEDSFCNCPTGQVWNSSTNQCEDRICPTGTVKAGDTIPDDQPDTWCDTTIPAPTCPPGTAKAGVIIPDGETEDTFCSCPAGEGWNSSTEQCEVAGRRCPGGTAKVGDIVPEGQPDAWCDGCPDGETWDLEAKACATDTVAPTVCPPGTAKAEQNIPAGQPVAWCDDCQAGSEWDLDAKACVEVLVPTPTCPAGTDKEGVTIPAGQTEDVFCNCGTGETWDAATGACVPETVTPTTCPVGTAKAGLQIPAGETEAGWCNCPTGQTWDAATNACVPDTVAPTLCPVGTAKAGVTIPAGQTEATFCNCPTGQTWDATTGACVLDTVVTAPTLCPPGSFKENQEVPAGETADIWCLDPWAQAKIDCSNTVGGATWDDANKECTPAATVDQFAQDKADCLAINSQAGGNNWEWNEYLMACVPVGTVNADGSSVAGSNLDLTEVHNAANAKLSALGSIPVGTTNDPYGLLKKDIGVFAGKTPGAPAIPTTVPNINDTLFGDASTGGGFGFAATSAAGSGDAGPYAGTGGSYFENPYGAKGGEVKEGGFAHGGEVEDRLGQRQNASDSRLMRHAGLGQFADEIGDEMLSTIARIMDRKD